VALKTMRPEMAAKDSAKFFLDIDVTDIPLAQYIIDQFYATCMAWSVPNAFIRGFNTGTVWTGVGIPNPANGHFTPLTDIAANGNYTCWTWGTYCFMSASYVASVQPECFAVFSPRQFSLTTGYDSHGRHVSTQAAAWVALGGNAAKVAAVVAMFGVSPTRWKRKLLL
jgi:hypothetical protein